MLTTTEHTVGNFLAVLESKINFAGSKGIKRVHFRTDGASNFKSTLLIPFIALGNRVRWNCDVMVASFSFWESGDGKGPIDVHFSYKNRKVEAYVDAGNDLLTPDDFYKALSGNGNPDACIKNSTVRLVDTASFAVKDADFSVQLSIRKLHCLDFFDADEPNGKECEVRLNWLAAPVVIIRKTIDEFATANPNFVSPVKSPVLSETTSSQSDTAVIGPALKRVRKLAETSLQRLTIERIQEAMNFETKLQVEFQQANGVFAPITDKQMELINVINEQGVDSYADKICDRRPPMPAHIDKKLDQLVSKISRHFATNTCSFFKDSQDRKFQQRERLLS